MMFAMNVYADQDQARLCLGSIRDHMPNVPIFVISDGTIDSAFADFCHRQHVDYTEGQRLKPYKNGGLWSQRFLLKFLDTAMAGDKLIKIDPCNMVKAPINILPNGDTFGWYLKSMRQFVHVQGYSYAGAKKIIDSKILQDDKYADLAYSYLWNGEHMSLQDSIMGDVIPTLKLSCTFWERAEIGNQ